MAFADWYLVHAALKINEKSQSLWNDFKAVAETNYANNKASRQDVIQAEVEFYRRDQRRILLERQRAEVMARINALANPEPGQPIPPPSYTAALTPLPNLATLREQAIDSRPELQALRKQLGAAESRVALAEKDFFPDFQLRAGHNALWDNRDKRWNVGFSVNIPFDQGKRRAAESGARARAKKLEWELRNLTATYQSEVDQAYARVKKTEEILSLLKSQLLPLAEENLDTALGEYRAGKGNFQALVRTGEQIIEVEHKYEEAQADYIRNLAALERAVGETLSPNPAEPHD